MLMMPVLFDDLQAFAGTETVCGHQAAYQRIDGGRVRRIVHAHHQITGCTLRCGDRKIAQSNNVLWRRDPPEYADAAACGSRTKMRSGNHVNGSRKIRAAEPYPGGSQRARHGSERGDRGDNHRAAI